MPLGTPEAWKDTLRDRSVDVLPLARDEKKDRTPGWCTYTYEHEQAPELEVLCGGINSKSEPGVLDGGDGPGMSVRGN